MIEIPEDIMKAVQAAWEKAWSKTGTTNAEAIREAIAFGIIAERQRCADVVMKMKSNTGVYVDRHDAHSAILNPNTDASGSRSSQG